MRRSVRKRLFLLLIAALILAAAAWQWRQQGLQASSSLLSMEPASISRVALRIGNQPTEHYEKRAEHWYRVDDAAVRVDDARLNKLTETAAAPVLSWRAAGDFNPSRIGLAPPSATLTLDGHALDFGETSVTGPQCYVRVGDRVALVPLSYTPSSPSEQAMKLP